MAENVVTIDIELNDSSLKKTLREINSEAKSIGDNTGKQLEESVFNKLNETLLALNASMDVFNKKMYESAESGSSFTKTIVESSAVLGGLGVLAASVGDNAANLFGGLATAATATSKNIFTVTGALAGWSAGLFIFGNLLRSTNSDLLNFIGGVLNLAAIISGGLAVAITTATILLGSFANKIGTYFVKAFESATEEFVKLEKVLFTSQRVIENYDQITKGAVGSVTSWREEVDKLSTSLNFNQVELTKSAQEIVAVTSKLGLNEQQMKKLLEVSAEYAKINGKDVFDTTVNIVSALNGQSQAVTALGIKLGEASNTVFAFKEGMKESFSTMSSAEQVQIRYNNLLNQYVGIAGIAQESASTLAEQNAKYEINVQKLNQSLGRGAAIIENNQIIAFGLNKAISLLNENVLSLAGFLGALGSRVLQIGGFFLEWSFKIFAVYKVISLLNILLAKDVTQMAFAKSIPFINKSLNDLVTSLAGTQIPLTNLRQVLTALATSITNTFAVALKNLTGSSTISFFNVLLGLIERLRFAFVSLGASIYTALAPLLPYVAAVAVVSGALYAVFKAFESLEEKTRVFTNLISIIRSEFERLGPVAEAFSAVFSNISAFISDFTNKSLGLLVFGLSKIVDLFIVIAANEPFGIISNEGKRNLASLGNQLSAFRTQLVASGFDMRQFGETAQASLAKATKIDVEKIIEQLNRLRTELLNVGLSQQQILKNQLDERLNILKTSLENELITQTEYNKLKLQAELYYAEEIKKIKNEQKKDVDEFTKAIGSALMGLQNVMSRTLQAIGAALVKGGSAFDNFGNMILGIIGDIMINVGLALIGIGNAINALAASLSTFFGGFAVAAGIALVVAGGALKAAVSDSKDSAASATGYAGGSGGFDAGAPAVAAPQLEDRKPKTEVVVNVEGNVFNGREQAQIIAENLQEYFDTNNGLLVRS